MMNSSINNQYKTQLINITQKFLAELNTAQSQHPVTLSDSLQEQLGIDSISRAELLSRIEKNLQVNLPLQSVIEAETLGDLLNIILNASPSVTLENTATNVSAFAHTITDVSRAFSIQDVLITHATATPDRPHMYLLDEQGKEQIITYKQLLIKAQQVAHALKSRGLEQHDTVALMLPTEAGFFYSFIGILLAGGVPVPVYPPMRANQIEEYAKKEIGILNNAAIRFLITFPQAKTLGKFLRPFVPSLKSVLTLDELAASTESAPLFRGNLSDIALIQYTSGSTNQPKGVTLTHYNLLSNIRAYGQALQITPQDVCINWLPLYHDLGLIGNWLGSLYFGLQLVTFSPLVFLMHPEKWLWAIHNYRGTISAGPNFAYELCVRKIDPSLIEGLNLSSWRLAINGAETIYSKTLQGFTQKFSLYGFKPEAFLPVYGLAENSLGLTTPEPGKLPRFDRVDRKLLEEEGRAVLTQSDNKQDYLEFACCGHVMPNHEIRIVDAHNVVVADRTVGHIQFHGPSSMLGYYNNPEITRNIYHDGWWETGDLGYMDQQKLFIVGRSKDVIIKAGRNLSATEIESIVSQVSGIRQGCVIAFSVNDEGKGTDKLIIVAETMQSKTKNTVDLQIAVSEKITSSLNVTPDEIVLIAPHTALPKTSSGKLQRNACKQLYLKGKLKKKKLPVSLQFFKIFTKSFSTKLKNQLIYIARFLYTLYIATIFALTFVPMWLIVTFAKQKTVDYAIKYWMRLICILSFCPRDIVREESLSHKGPIIYAANHCSYLDVALLIGLLPAGVRFVGKRSLFHVPILKNFLEKLSHIPVDKKDSTKGLDDMNRIASALQQGQSVLIFPEGTFSHAAGLRPFKLSAFKIAVDLSIPICPISINGTREVLRGNSIIMKWHPVDATIGPLYHPQGKDWADVIQLKNRIREKILADCGEISLDFILPDASARKKDTR